MTYEEEVDVMETKVMNEEHLFDDFDQEVQCEEFYTEEYQLEQQLDQEEMEFGAHQIQEEAFRRGWM